MKSFLQLCCCPLEKFYLVAEIQSVIEGNGYFSADQELEKFWLKSFLLHESFCSKEILKSDYTENDTCSYDINICK